MSKELNSREGVYTKTSGTGGSNAEVNVLSIAKKFMKHEGLVITLVSSRSEMGILQTRCIPIF